jgi:hypothetical protein
MFYPRLSMCRGDVLPWLIQPNKDFRHKIDRLVDTVLLHGSVVDTNDFLPVSYLDQLVASGLVTVVAAPDSIWNVLSRFAITEQIAFGCLDTWFVMTQHWGASSIVMRSDCSPLASFWDSHSLLGVGFGHLRRSSPCLRAEITGNQLTMRGFAPWVTGSRWLSWVIYGATLPDGNHIYVRLPHVASDGYRIGHPQELAALRRTDTCEVVLDLTVTTDSLICIRPLSDLSSQDEVTLVTSISPILGLIGRCLLDWSNEVKPDNQGTFDRLFSDFGKLRSEAYAMISNISATAVNERLELRQKAHTLLETIIHIWCLSSGGQSNTSGMMVNRRRNEAAFFRVFQQTKKLKDTAIITALNRITD